MHNLSAGPAAAQSRLPASRAARERAEHTSKLVLSGVKDRLLIESVAGYPARLQSCVLAAWLRGGWHLTRRRPVDMIPPPAPAIASSAARLTRRVRFDDPADPALAGFLLSLPRKERGREIRHFISLALKNGGRRAP